MVKQNTILKNRLDELNGKQEVHEEINAGQKMWKKAQKKRKMRERHGRLNRKKT